MGKPAEPLTSTQSLFNIMTPGSQPPTRPPPRGLEKFTPAELLKFTEQMDQGKMPPELAAIFGNVGHVGPDGKPIIDKEGGATIQPEKGFVVKTFDVKSNGKVFVNMTSHELIEPMSEKYIPEQDREKAGGNDRGVRIPLSLGDQQEERDKKGEPALVFDVIWAPDTV